MTSQVYIDGQAHTYQALAERLCCPAATAGSRVRTLRRRRHAVTWAALQAMGTDNDRAPAPLKPRHKPTSAQHVHLARDPGRAEQIIPRRSRMGLVP